MNLNWPLMRENISDDDVISAMTFLASKPLARLTQGEQVAAFEREFAEWLGVKYAVMVNSGASANLITMMALAQLYGKRDVIVPTITWSSDIMSVMHAGMRVVFADIRPDTLGMNLKTISTAKGAYVFATHCLGFDSEILSCDGTLIEDCCESIGATRNGKKLGTFGLASNFSFYYGHHMTTIEGGMVCTDDHTFYQQLRMLRAHGLKRERSWEAAGMSEMAYPDLHPEFIFMCPAFNMRSTEINAVIGRSQLKRLDTNIKRRTENLLLFLSLLDADKYRTDYRVEGSSNFALPLILREPREVLMQKVLTCLREHGVEYRRGTAGGGNQTRQPYLKHLCIDPTKFPETEHVHFYGLYVGNYPDLEPESIDILCKALNAL